MYSGEVKDKGRRGCNIFWWFLMGRENSCRMWRSFGWVIAASWYQNTVVSQSGRRMGRGTVAAWRSTGLPSACQRGCVWGRVWASSHPEPSYENVNSWRHLEENTNIWSECWAKDGKKHGRGVYKYGSTTRLPTGVCTRESMSQLSPGTKLRK